MTLDGIPGSNEGKETFVTTTDTCGLCGAKLKNAETSRLEWQGEAAKCDRRIRELEQQLAQAHATWSATRNALDRWPKHCGATSLPLWHKDALKLNCGKGWLSPDESKRLENCIAICEAKNEELGAQIKRLEAVCAVMRDALQYAKVNKHKDRRFEGCDVCDLCEVIDQALSTAAGKDLVEKLERYEKALRYYASIQAYMIPVDENLPILKDGGKIAREALKGDKP